jgi:hypothetical protein
MLHLPPLPTLLPPPPTPAAALLWVPSPQVTCSAAPERPAVSRERRSAVGVLASSHPCPLPVCLLGPPALLRGTAMC